MLFPISLIVLLGIWESWVRLADIAVYRLPAPSVIFNQSQQTYFLLLQHLGITLTEVTLGMLVGISLAFITAVIFYWFPITKKTFYPYARMVNAMPIPAIASLIVIWVGVGITSKLVTATICAFFPVVCHTYAGLCSVDPLRRKFMKSINASRWQMLRYLELPYAAPQILAALETAVTVVVVGVFVGEMLGGNQGLGFYVLNVKYRMDTPKVMLATLATMFLGWFLSEIIILLRKRIIPWHDLMNRR